MFREETRGYLRVHVASEIKALRDAEVAGFAEDVSRLKQGLFLVLDGAVRACEHVEGDVLVRGSAPRSEYRTGEKRCECADFFFRGERVCKHQHARRLFLIATATEALLQAVDLTRQPNKQIKLSRKGAPRPPTPHHSPNPAPQLDIDPEELERRWLDWAEQLGSL